MAAVTIPVSRQDYKDATQTVSQYNGWKPNTVSGALSAQAITASDTITIPADFKDHKTVFLVQNTASAAATLTIKKGDSYQGVNDLVLSVPQGDNLFWLDSAKFVDKTTGVITVTTTASSGLKMIGYEMR